MAADETKITIDIGPNLAETLQSQGPTDAYFNQALAIIFKDLPSIVANLVVKVEMNKTREGVKNK